MYHLIRRDTGRLANEAFNLTVQKLQTVMSNNCFLLPIAKIKTNLKLAYVVYCALFQALNIK